MTETPPPDIYIGPSDWFDKFWGRSRPLHKLPLGGVSPAPASSPGLSGGIYSSSGAGEEPHSASEGADVVIKAITALQHSGYDVQVLEMKGTRSSDTGLTVVSAYKFAPTDIQYVSGISEASLSLAGEGLQYFKGGEESGERGIEGATSAQHALWDTPSAIRTDTAIRLGPDGVVVNAVTTIDKALATGDLMLLQPNIQFQVIHTGAGKPVVFITTTVDTKGNARFSEIVSEVDNSPVPQVKAEAIIRPLDMDIRVVPGGENRLEWSDNIHKDGSAINLYTLSSTGSEVDSEDPHYASKVEGQSRIITDPQNTGSWSYGLDQLPPPSIGEDSGIYPYASISDIIRFLQNAHYDVRVLDMKGAGSSDTGLTVVTAYKFAPTNIQHVSDAVARLSGRGLQYFEGDGIEGGISVTHDLGNMSNAIRTDTVINLGPDGISVRADTAVNPMSGPADLSSLQPNIILEVMYTWDDKPVVFITTTVDTKGNSGNVRFGEVGGYMRASATLTDQLIRVTPDENNKLVWSDSYQNGSYILNLYTLPSPELAGFPGYGSGEGWMEPGQYISSLPDDPFATGDLF